jgi:hypothetical protein
MEGWGQRQLGREKLLSNEKAKERDLTPTGLLMEGDYTNNPVSQRSLDSWLAFLIFFKSKRRKPVGAFRAPLPLDNVRNRPTATFGRFSYSLARHLAVFHLLSTTSLQTHE